MPSDAKFCLNLDELAKLDYYFMKFTESYFYKNEYSSLIVLNRWWILTFLFFFYPRNFKASTSSFIWFTFLRSYLKSPSFWSLVYNFVSNYFSSVFNTCLFCQFLCTRWYPLNKFVIHFDTKKKKTENPKKCLIFWSDLNKYTVVVMDFTAIGVKGDVLLSIF